MKKNDGYFLIYIFSLILFSSSFIFNSFEEIKKGLIIILYSRDNLISDYMQIANIGAAFFNCSVLTILSTLFLQIKKIQLNARYIAALLTVSGFSLFGKNIINSIPLSLGVILYIRIKKEDFQIHGPNILFVNALAPVVTETALRIKGMEGIIISLCMSILIGFLFIPLSLHFMSFHKGFNLYNAGFTAGIIAMFYRAFLHSIGIDIKAADRVLRGANHTLLPVLIIISSFFIIYSLIGDKKVIFKYMKLIKNSGENYPDYPLIFGQNAAILNSGILGLLSTLYVLLVGGELNGPIIGGIFTIMGFAFLGKNIRNALPIFLGVYCASLINIYDSHSTAALLAALFGTTLCPVAGYYGFFFGFCAAFMHMALSQNIGFVHSGLNLYNNGFSGGFIAAFMVAVLDNFNIKKRIYKKNILTDCDGK